MDDNTAMNTILFYADADGHIPFDEWIDKMSDGKAKIAIDRRIIRLESGNPGDCKPLRDGVWELRIDVGQGYRVYYAKTGLTIVLLLCGGDKRTQNSDIDRACEYWRDWQSRKEKQ